MQRKKMFCWTTKTNYLCSLCLHNWTLRIRVELKQMTLAQFLVFFCCLFFLLFWKFLKTQSQRTNDQRLTVGFLCFLAVAAFLLLLLEKKRFSFDFCCCLNIFLSELQIFKRTDFFSSFAQYRFVQFFFFVNHSDSHIDSRVFLAV